MAWIRRPPRGRKAVQPEAGAVLGPGQSGPILVDGLRARVVGHLRHSGLLHRRGLSRRLPSFLSEQLLFPFNTPPIAA
jgi:hypothetical protein